MSRTTPGATGFADLAPAKPEGPLYLQIARALREGIISGTYPVGSQLPTEDALTARFSVSRYTVREALRRLRDDGLIASRQGAGTIVMPPSSAATYVHHAMSINDLVAFVTGTRLAIDTIALVAIDDALAVATGLPLGEEWLQVRGFRRVEATDAPVSHAEYYINRDFAAVGRLLQRHTGPIFPLIEDLFGQSIAEVHQEITATLLLRTLAEGLGAAEGSAALAVRRAYRTLDGITAQVTINTHPAARFSHSMTMRRMRG